MRKKFNLKMLCRRYSGEDGAGGSSEGNSENTQTLTNEQVEALKNSASQSAISGLLKTLNIEDTESLTAMIEAQKEADEKNKSELDKERESTKSLKKDNLNLTARATEAENKLALFKAGVNIDLVDEALALVNSNIKEDVDFTKALEQVKAKVPFFFGDSTNPDDGTGKGAGNKKPPITASGLGARLATKGSADKNPYFHN